MQRDSSPVLLPNTFRDSNDTSTTSKEFILPSAANIEQMNLNSEARHSIIRSVESDHLQSTRIPSPNRNRITNKPLVRSIIRSNGSEDERPSEEQTQPVFNGHGINENDAGSEASGIDTSRLTGLDADAQYALQLQQEEYSRESLMADRHQFLPFQVEPDDESAATNSALSYDSDTPQFTNDEQFAAYLQEQEDRRQRQYRQPPISFFPIRQRSNPGSTRTSETDGTEMEANVPFPYLRRQPMSNDDDDDEETPPVNNAQALLQFLASQGGMLPEGFPPFLSGFRRGYRRSGNLQDTEEDFGPEDYERLLQLDDSIHKKKLTKEQINTLPIEHFKRQSSNNDEENKCGICLEFFGDDQIVRRFPCRHVYHQDCGDRWLQENNVCPICREPPVKVPPSSNSRYHRGAGGSRRPPNTHRNSSNRNNNNNNNNNNNTHHRRGPPPPRQS